MTKSRALSQLAELGASGLGIGDEGLRRLAETPRDRQWERLDLSRNGLTDESARLLASHPAFAGLRELKLSDNGIGREGAAALAESPVLETLEDLELDGNPIQWGGVITLLASRRLSELVRLRVDAAGWRPEESADDALALNGRGDFEGSVRVLMMDSPRRTDWPLTDLAASPLMANVRDWSMSGFSLSASAIRAFVRSPYLKRLQRLRLRNCGLDRDGALELSCAVPVAMPGLLEADLRLNSLFPGSEREVAEALGPCFRIL